ncbi:flagellar biosynthetic protein FliO [Radiobacillus kanasensis]|uniref:flagellar biosynthetic protein FliO n=1 Tax=Radiobacillus kanasensis TaxID=2844358 RepID=UPI001E46D516|nr:flagellar biosynthetic protein FliO [Radiobacillus kanasensis]UFU01036.1 flagellar biosynthetic protein FliO [Radiobacillus kanasensis]
MLKKIILFFLLFVSITSFVQVEAAPSVTECLENPKNCETDQEKPEEENQEDQQQDQDSVTKIEEESSQEGPSLFLNFIKLILALGFILALIYFLLKFVNKRNKMFQRVRTLENLGGLSLGANKSMQIVRIGDKVFVVGVGDNIELLTEITDEATLQELKTKEELPEFNPSNLITSLLNKTKNKTGNPAQDSPKKQEFQQAFQSELSKVKSIRNQLMDRRKNRGEDNHE